MNFRGDNMSRVGDMIKKARSERGMTQKQLARKCGLSESYITDIESGKRIINENLVKRISGILGKDISEPLYEPEDEEIETEKEEVPQKADQKAPNAEWESAFSSVIKDIPVFDIDMDKVVGYKHLPVIDRKVEGCNPEKIIFMRAPDNSLGGFRIRKGDILMIALGGECSAGFYLMEYDGRRAIRQTRLLGSGKVLIMSSDGEIRTETKELREIKVLGRCIRDEFNL